MPSPHKARLYTRAAIGADDGISEGNGDVCGSTEQGFGKPPARVPADQSKGGRTMPSVRTIDDVDVAGKRVLVRVDFNVPMKDGKVTDTTRIDRTVPSLKELSDKGAKVIVLSHLGRPKGKKNLEFTQKPVAEALAKALGKPVAFAPDCIGPEAKKAVDALKPGEFAMLENVRFYAEEEKNDPEFAKKLAELGDVLVSDAFSASHRAHASVEGLAHIIPAVAGR